MDIKSWNIEEAAKTAATDGASGTKRSRAPTPLEEWLTDATVRASRIEADAVIAGGDLVNPHALFVGKAPAEEEMRHRRPFAGKSGGKGGLARMLGALAMRLGANGGAIATNAAFWSTPAGRDPSAAQCARAAPFIAEMIERVRPRVIVALGAIAADTLIGQTNTVQALRGRWHRCSLVEEACEVRVSYHPAYLLREPRQWSRADADIEAVRRRLAGEPE